MTDDEKAQLESLIQHADPPSPVKSLKAEIMNTDDEADDEMEIDSTSLLELPRMPVEKKSTQDKEDWLKLMEVVEEKRVVAVERTRKRKSPMTPISTSA